jgi:hypothetical protein
VSGPYEDLNKPDATVGVGKESEDGRWKMEDRKSKATTLAV